MGSPKFITGPMVDFSDLAFRMITRKYGAQLCYTQMFHARNFAISAKYRQQTFQTIEADRPLIVQLAGNETEHLIRSAELVSQQCNAVDINLGCPQRVASRGKYGIFLLEQDTALVYQIVQEMSARLQIPVTCKIRMVHDIQTTVNIASNLQAHGCKLLTIHGRTRDQVRETVGLCDWEVIKAVKQSLQIPVFANGGVSNFNDVVKCFEQTQVDGVMSAEKILESPCLFSNNEVDQDLLAQEYLDIVDQLQQNENITTEVSTVKGHMFKFLFNGLMTYTDIRSDLVKCTNVQQVREIANKIRELRKN